MSNGITSITKGAAPAASTQNAASRLKHELMADALERMLDKGNEKPIAPGQSACPARGRQSRPQSRLGARQGAAATDVRGRRGERPGNEIRILCRRQ